MNKIAPLNAKLFRTSAIALALAGLPALVGAGDMDSATAAAIARMWSGVVPQQPPTMFRKPASTKSDVTLAMCSGVSSYSPNSFGSPAFG